MAKHSRSKRLVISFAVAVGFLGALEIALRLAKFDHPPAEFPILVWNPDEDRLMDTADYLFQPDVHSLWTLRPGARVQFGPAEAIGGPAEYVNTEGYRGPLRPKEHSRDILRIVTLGDSSTYGLGVRYEETYSARLEELLNASGVRAEVIDGGVDGFTVRQGIERYRSLFRAYHPDVVIAAFGAVNEHWPALDLDDDAKIRRSIERSDGLARSRRWIRREARIAHLVAWAMSPRAVEAALKRADRQRQMQEVLAETASQQAWPGERRVSTEHFMRTLIELEDEVARDGARLILIAMPRRAKADTHVPVLRAYTIALLKVAEIRKLQVLYALAHFRDRGEAAEPELFLRDDWHPSPQGHRLIAELLAPMIRDPALNSGEDAAFARQ